MAVQTRLAGPHDVERIEGIENEADQLLIGWLKPERWAAAPTGLVRSSEPGFILVAEDELGTLLGFAHVLEANGIAHLEQLSVLPKHGRRGNGRRLIEVAKDEARRRGYSRMTLRTYADVPWNAPFYTRAGFTEEQPSTPFHRRLVEDEARLGIQSYGRRVQMACVLT